MKKTKRARDFRSGYTTFESGLVFNRFGGQKSVSDIKVEIRLDYLSVPVVGKFNFSGDASRTAFLKAGFLPGVLVGKEATLTKGSTTVSSSDFGVKSTDLPAVAGLGAAFPVSMNNSMILEATYVRGLTNISENSDANTRNEGFIISAGLTFEI